jgi:hypothetical protein
VFLKVTGRGNSIGPGKNCCCVAKDADKLIYGLEKARNIKNK